MLLYLPHFNLQNFNTLASPVSATFFVPVNSPVELLEAITFAREQALPLLVLGGGSNIVLASNFQGLAVQIHLLGKSLVAEDEKYFYIQASAGENWHEFVDFCLDCGYWGLENLSLIPGSVGAAPIDLVCDIRQSKLPNPKQIPNVGSFFKNPIVSDEQLQLIQLQHPNVVFYPAGAGLVKLAAGWLVDCAGWRGYKDELAAVHDQQALVLTNPNRLTGDMVLALSHRIQESIFHMFGVMLELEPRVYPSA